MPRRITGLHVTETTLTCSGLHDVAPAIADAIRTWLHTHNLDENQVLAAHPIVRDPEKRTLTWTSIHRDQPMTVIDQAPLTALDPWPAPFPDLLLQQPDPAGCPACGRAYDDPEETE